MLRPKRFAVSLFKLRYGLMYEGYGIAALKKYISEALEIIVNRYSNQLAEVFIPDNTPLVRDISADEVFRLKARHLINDVAFECACY